MCLILFSIIREQDKIHDTPKLSYLMMANRDEYYSRPTSQMAWWKEGDILAGRDMQAGGTWLGIAKNGKFAAITNYKEDNHRKLNELSRGKLVTDYLMDGNISGVKYLKNLNGKDFAGFSLLIGDTKGIHCYSNRSKGITSLTEGVHVLGNLLLDSQTEKAISMKEDFELLNVTEVSPEVAFNLMAKKDGTLNEQTQEDLRKRDEEEIPYRFIRSKIYGTRCSTFLTVKSSGEVRVSEQTYLQEGKQGSRKDYNFLVTD